MNRQFCRYLLPILVAGGGLFLHLSASGQTNLNFELKGRWPGYPRGNAYGVQVAGNYAYVVQWSAGLAIYSIAQPTNIFRVGGYDTPGYAVRVQLAGSLAYLADAGSGLHILNVADPTNVVRLGGTTRWERR
jgi:hypothetical protein